MFRKAAELLYLDMWQSESLHRKLQVIPKIEENVKLTTHPKRITVWWRFWSRGIIGPFSLENEQGQAVTAHGNRYRVMLNEFLFTKIEAESIGNIWFQQDGVTCRTAKATLDILRAVIEPQSWCRLATSFGCRQREVLRRQAGENWRFKRQYSWSHWWKTAAHNR